MNTCSREHITSSIIAGVDEAGRGPLAGPVVAAAVILSDANIAEQMADSKKLSVLRRDELYQQIFDHADAIGIGVIEAPDIDRLNILQATMRAMETAINKLALAPTKVFVDGNRCPRCRFPIEAVIRGDDKIAEISAASIIAKVTRDRIMLALHDEYPEYGFDVHKGYPTKRHRDAIMTYGVTAIHRRTFGPVKEALATSA